MLSNGSRIIAGDAAKDAGKISWRKVGSAPAAIAGAGNDQGNRGSDATALEAHIAQLQAELANRESQAKRAGYEEGEAAAKRNLEGPYRQAMSKLAAQVGELAGLRKRLRREAEEDMVKLAIAIARRVLRRELATDPEAILGLVKAALSRVEARDILRVRIHPEDARTLQACLGELGLPDRVELAPDRNLERGAVIVETSRGELDASIETQLQEIERGFADLLRRQS
jgi:flagellar assembly protein FliH